MDPILSLSTFTTPEMMENEKEMIRNGYIAMINKTEIWGKFWAGENEMAQVKRTFSNLRYGRERDKWCTWTLDHQYHGNKYSGTLPKRLALLAWKERGVKIPEEIISIMGTVLGTDRVIPKVFFEVDKFTDWRHGNFEPTDNPGHCWWSNFEHARLGLQEDPAGFSLLIYKNEDDWKENRRVTGIGRCFMYQLNNDGFVMFNAYGELPLSALASIMAHRFKRVAHRTSITANWPVYLNKGNANNEGRKGGDAGLGYYIGNRTRSNYDLPDFRIRNSSCNQCLEKFNSGNLPITVTSEGRAHICVDCLRNGTMCCMCNIWMRESTAVRVRQGGDLNSACPKCAATLHKCISCLVPTVSPKKIHHSTEFICDRCLRDHNGAAVCSACKRVVQRFAEIGNICICYLHPEVRKK